MAVTNYERVGKALELLKDGLLPFVERELKSEYQQDWFEEVRDAVHSSQASLFTDEETAPWDAASLLAVIWFRWQEVFRRTLGQPERSLVSELRDVRNRWAHQNPFTGDDTYRALDSIERLLTAMSAPQSEAVGKVKKELLRLQFDEQVRGEKRKSAGTAIESAATGSLKPWREVVVPHADVASGRYQQAEFAADLWQVYRGEGSDEYRDPVEFFRRTYLTASLKDMLVGAVRRMSGEGGDPVVQLQTNFGGGKTHSMLALFHLFSGVKPSELPGMEPVMAEAGVEKLPSVRRVVLVGNKISPGNPTTKPDGTVVRTLWGELAWQLGGKPAFDRIAADDEHATNPGDVLRDLFNECGPCIILIDEWVAYARQLHDDSDLPGGSFETQFTFAQALTESAKLAKNCLLVISLPASDIGSAHPQADNVEVGGQRGREALDRLSNVVGRIESSWRPASAEEGFEIVRRRLFEPILDPARFKDRDVVANKFAELYRNQHQEFPPECRDAEYEKRIKAAYPIHPEIFDRLYTDWSTLVKFQRTRGVLRLMAAVIHSLWEKGDRSSLILPASIPIDDPRIREELTRYLSDNWVPIIEKDVDGPNSLPLKIDGEVPNLGQYSACRRVARTIYLGSAPMVGAAHHGIEDRQVKLGCVMPGEPPSIFGDALRRLAGAATYLYQDGQRYWYSTQPTVTKLAEDRAEQFRRDSVQMEQELEKRIRDNTRQTGDFHRIHCLPKSGHDVPDDLDARLVVLGRDQPHSKDGESKALVAAKAILASRGSAPRLYANTLVFLAPDKTRLQELEQAAREYLAWASIVDDKNVLDLTPQQVRQAEERMRAANDTVTSRIPETYIWLLVPKQEIESPDVTWEAIRLSGSDTLAARACRKLKSDELLLTSFAPFRLQMELNRIPLWRGNDVSIRQLVEDFASYLYLPRLATPSLVLSAVSEGVALLSWEADAFAYADAYDDKAARYRGLRAGEHQTVNDLQSTALVVKPEVAMKQLEAEREAARIASTAADGSVPGSPYPPALPSKQGVTEPAGPAVAAPPKRFHGSVSLNPQRIGSDASKIAEEVIAHLAGLVNANVRVTLEVQAEIPDGASEHVVRTVTENARTLKFDSQGFEKE